MAYYQQQKCRPMTLVSRNIRYMRIFARVLQFGGVKDDGIAIFVDFDWLLLRKL